MKAQSEEPVTEIQTVDQHDLILRGNPAAEAEFGITAAKILKQLIEKRHDRVVIRGKTIPQYQDWQMLARFHGLSIRTFEATPVCIDGVDGVKARAELLNRDGQVVGGAEAVVMRSEGHWADKPIFQLCSMAQVRAGRRACANCLGWVMTLAGYEATPADEMDQADLNRQSKPVARSLRQHSPKDGDERNGLVLSIKDTCHALNQGISDDDKKWRGPVLKDFIRENFPPAATIENLNNQQLFELLGLLTTRLQASSDPDENEPERFQIIDAIRRDYKPEAIAQELKEKTLESLSLNELRTLSDELLPF